MNGEVIIREATMDDGGAINALFERVFHKPRSLETWRWLFHETPGGSGHAVVASRNGELIGHAGTIRRHLKVGEATLLSGQSIDAMTAPEDQKQGINQRLNQALDALHKQDEVAVVYGFSNRHSTHAVIHHQKRFPLSPFPVMVRPLRWLRLPTRVLRRVDRLPSSHPITIPNEVDALWESSRSQHPINIIRDAPYFRWRYARPDGVYKLVEIRKGGELTALGVLGFRTQMGLLTAFVTDVVVGNEAPEAWDELVSALVDSAHSADCDVISALAYPYTNAQTAFRRGGLRAVPAWLNPEDIDFSVRDNEIRPLSVPLTRREAWHLCWAEHDLT